MVLITLTPAAKDAVDEYCALKCAESGGDDEGNGPSEKDLANAEVGSSIDHGTLVEISKFLVQRSRGSDTNNSAKEWRLETLLTGANVYQPPPPPKPETTPAYKALMKRLREEEERKQYERMTNVPPPQETFSQRYPQAAYSFDPATSIGQGPGAEEVDDVTYADVNRQMALIINVLVSIIACSVAIWIGARSWAVPQRLGLSMSGSGIVAIAEVAIYMGYIRRVKEAKDTEVKVVETKEITETWVLDGTTSRKPEDESIRHRKGKHR